MRNATCCMKFAEPGSRTHIGANSCAHNSITVLKRRLAKCCTNLMQTKMKEALLAVDAASVAVFLATIDSVSSPCGLGENYYGSSLLQWMDVLGTYVRGVMLLASLSYIALDHDDNVEKAMAYLYRTCAVIAAVLSLASSLVNGGLDCPNADNLMGCDSAAYWMVPRNYCAAQLKTQLQGCVLPSSSSADSMQMCVRAGRAPLVNGAFGAWLLRTLLTDTMRVVIVAWAFVYDKTTETALQKGQQTVNNETRAASANFDEDDTLLLPKMPDDGVIRQSPHVRKRTAASNFKINF